MRLIKKLVFPLVLCIVVLVYLPMFNNGFVNLDDNRFVLKNDWIQEFSLTNLKHMFTDSKEGHYQPITWVMYSVQYALFSINAKGYHLVSLIVHLMNIILLAFILSKFTNNKNLIYACCLVFGIHPIHVEVVAWKSAQSTLWYSFFTLFSIWNYIQYLHSNHKKYFVLSSCAFILAVFSKSAAVIIPLYWVLFDYYFKKNTCITSVIRKAPFFLFSCVMIIMAVWSSKKFGSFNQPDVPYTILDRFFIISYALFFYISKFFIPIQYSAIHFNPLKNGIFLPFYFYLVPFFMIGFWVAVYYAFKQKKNVFILLMGLFIIPLILVSQIVSIGNTIAAERYAYLAIIPLSFFLIYIVFILLKNVKIQYAIFGLIISIFSFQTVQRIKVWNNNFDLYSNMISEYPNQYYAYYAFSVSLYDMSLYTNALNYAKQGEKLKPNSSKLQYIKGLIYVSLQQPDSAIISFSKCIANDLKNKDAYYNRALAYSQINEYEKAIRDLTIVLGYEPSHKLALQSRANLKYIIKDYVGALADIQKIESYYGKSTFLEKNKEKILLKIKELN